MHASDSHLKFLFAFSLPPLMILLSIIGGDAWGAYKFCATILVIAGGICAASIVHGRSNKYVTAILYMVILELLLLLLP
jgi:uncharacterized membrane protein YoaK (UPF0700 family)